MGLLRGHRQKLLWRDSGLNTGTGDLQRDTFRQRPVRKEGREDASIVSPNKMDFQHPEMSWTWSRTEVKEGPVSRDPMEASVFDSVFLLEFPRPRGRWGLEGKVKLSCDSPGSQGP